MRLGHLSEQIRTMPLGFHYFCCDNSLCGLSPPSDVPAYETKFTTQLHLLHVDAHTLRSDDVVAYRPRWQV